MNAIQCPRHLSGILISMLILLGGVATALTGCSQSSGPDSADVLRFGDKALEVTLKREVSGLSPVSIKSGSRELLGSGSRLFSVTILRRSDLRTSVISSASGWGDVAVQNSGKGIQATFTQPLSDSLPNSLQVMITIDSLDSRSQWDLSVTGLGDEYSLVKVDAFQLALKSGADDQLFIPKYSGKLIADPVGQATNLSLLYPRGWSTSMQYVAQYDSTGGVYLGFHDPLASTKYFKIATGDQSLLVSSEFIIPNETLPGNNWSMPGVFEVDSLHGDWYDAAMIYKGWAQENADYWPQMNNARKLRQQQLGRIGVWAYYAAGPEHSMERIEREMQDYSDYFSGIPVGIHWYQWNGLKQDNDYPHYFPERTGMQALISHLQAANKAYVMPYINGRLYDTDLPDYAVKGYPSATKNSLSPSSVLRPLKIT